MTDPSPLAAYDGATHHSRIALDVQPLTLLLHTRASGGGGAERVFSVLARGLAARGHRVTLAVDEIDPSCTALPGVTLLELGTGHAGAVRRLAGLIRGTRYDVAASAVSVSAVKLVAARALAFSGLPVVVSFHGFEEYRTGRLSALAYRGLKVAGPHLAAIVAVSDGLRDALVRDWGAPADRTVRIYNPVSLPAELGSPSAAEIAARPPTIAALGRLSPEKGMLDLVEALAAVRTPGVRLVIGGEGPERAAIEARVSALNLSGRVTLLGAVPGPAAVFSGAKVAAVPSHSEAFGLAAVEALAFGLPLVATDCGGPREILDGGRLGRLVPVGDTAAMASALEAALANPGDPAPRIERAQAFSEAVGLDAWEDLLRRAAAGRGAQGSLSVRRD